MNRTALASTKWRTRAFAAAMALLASVTFLVSCIDKRTPEQQKNTLVYGFGQTFKTFDPAKVVYAQEAAIIMQVQETLVVFDENLKLKGCLATSWETPDHCNSWVFHLRPNVKFHDGLPFTSDAVKFTFERILDPKTASTRSRLWEEIAQIDTPDDLTVVFRLKAPNCVFPEKLVSSSASIPSPAAVQQLGEKYATNPVGTGPFKFVDWVPDVVIRMKKNHEHWNADNYHIENLEFRSVKENTTRFIELEQGVLDIADLEFPQVNVARKSSDIELQSVPQLSIRYVGFNTQKPPFSDRRVRQAANYAVNKDDLIKYMFFGVGEPAIGPIPSVLPGFNPNVHVYNYDPEKAKELLAEAGYPNGFDADFWTYEQGIYRSTADYVVESLRNVGINAKMKILDNGAYWDKFDAYITPDGKRYPTKEGVFDIFVGGWVGGETVEGFLDPLFRSNSNSNSSFYNNAEVDKLLVDYKTKESVEERLAIYRRLQEIIVEDAPWIFAFHGQLNTGVRKHVKGYRTNPSLLYNLEGVTLEPESVNKK
ncbi:MAG TPA: ABC transporter substrate-binding protein [Candidatus Sumerlaeota bacterium]|nr:ABC transporter substrate-binding protein [Candidatus Sumerlaeota bacterium]